MLSKLDEKLINLYSTQIETANTVYASTRLNEDVMPEGRTALTARQINNQALLCEGSAGSDLASLKEAISLDGSTVSVRNVATTTPGDLGVWKMFATQIATDITPNQISPEIVTVTSMPNRWGVYSYLKFFYGTNKGAQYKGQAFVSPYGVSNDSLPTDYTGETTSVETIVGSSELYPVGNTITLNFKPVIKVISLFVNGESLTEGEDFTLDDDVITLTTALSEGDTLAIRYRYDLQNHPLESDPATLYAEMTEITLHAELHEIDVSWTLFTQFVAKKDREMDLAAQLTAQAANTVALEQDRYVVNQLYDVAFSEDNYIADAEFDLTKPVGVSLADHYATFGTKVNELTEELYYRTSKYYPTYLVCGRGLIPLLSYLPGFTSAKRNENIGAYYAGTYQGMKVYVAPLKDKYAYFTGVYGDGAAVAILGKYMEVVPGIMFSVRGWNTQCFFTAYAFEILNRDLILGSKIIPASTPN